MRLSEKFLVKPGKKLDLSDIDPDCTAGFKGKKEAQETVEKNLARLSELQFKLYAENRRSLLIVLQAMDAAGKDGTIRHVFGAFNPQGCRVSPFKVPSAEELAHDFLWRIHRATPRTGEIGIFNRSHYEDVLVVRVHEIVQKSVWSQRFDQINDFERHLADNDVTIIKFFLHISKDEQLERFKKRLEDPTRQWKISPADFKERKLWKDYMAAYNDAIGKCSTKWAPWYVIPANHKWFRNLAVSQIIAETLEDMKLKFPKPNFDLSKIVVE